MTLSETIKKSYACFIFLLFFATNGFAYSSIMRIGTNLWPGYEPLYLAEKIGAWPESAHIRLIQFTSSTEVMRAFRNRTLEAATLTMDEVLQLKESGFSVKVVLVMDVSHGADVIMAPKGWKNFEEMKGKRVGVESSALGAYVITRFLAIHNMKISNIQVINIEVDHHEEAFLNGDVDAVVTFEPVRTTLLNSGAQELCTSKEIPGEIVDVLVVHDDFLQDGSDKLRLLIRGWFNAIEMIKSKPFESAIHIAPRLRIRPEEVIESYKGIQFPDMQANQVMIGGDNPIMIKSTSKLIQVMEDAQLIMPGITMDALFTTQYLQ